MTEDNYISICPSKGLLKNIPIHPIRPFFGNSDRFKNSAYYLVYIKDFFKKKGYIDYIKHPEKAWEDFTSPDLKTKDANWIDFVMYPFDLYKNYMEPSLPKPIESAQPIKTQLPKTFQAVWITNRDHPTAINHYQANNFIAQANKLEGYEAVIWTNINSEKLKQLNPELENVTIKNIADIDTQYTQLLEFVLSPKNYIKQPALIKNYNGLLIDLIKYIILESQGGFLADFNFEFYEKFNSQALENIDFIAIHKEFTFIENSFFLAKPHHVIFKELLSVIHDMLFDYSDCGLVELRERIAHDGYKSVTDVYSMSPLIMSYMKYNNKDGNYDILITNSCGYRECVKPTMYSQYFQMTQEHDERDLLDSSNFNEIQQYSNSCQEIISAFRLFAFDQECNNCVFSDLVGGDAGNSQSWREADIA